MAIKLKNIGRGLAVAGQIFGGALVEKGKREEAEKIRVSARRRNERSQKCGGGSPGGYGGARLVPSRGGRG